MKNVFLYYAGEVLGVIGGFASRYNLVNLKMRNVGFLLGRECSQLFVEFGDGAV